MARHGPILNHNEATGSRKVLKYLLGLWDIISILKIAAKVQKSKNAVKCVVFRILDFGRHF